MLLVECGKFFKGIFANDIGIEDKEWRVVFPKDFLGEFERTSSSERLSLNGELDANVVLFFVLWIGTC